MDAAVGTEPRRNPAVVNKVENAPMNRNWRRRCLRGGDRGNSASSCQEYVQLIARESYLVKSCGVHFVGVVSKVFGGERGVV